LTYWDRVRKRFRSLRTLKKKHESKVKYKYIENKRPPDAAAEGGG
jgi:hypothetical protein